MPSATDSPEKWHGFRIQDLNDCIASSKRLESAASAQELFSGMFKRILVAYDQSPEAESAATTVLGLAAHLKAKVLLVTVMAPPSGFDTLANSIQAGYLEETRRQELEALTEKHNSIKAKASEAQVEIENRILEGPVLENLLSAVESFHPDLVVLGLHHHGHGLDLIGTLHRVARDLQCPIMAVPDMNKIKTA